MTYAALTQDGYIPWNVSKFLWVPAISNMAAPTRTELNAGTDLSPQVVGWTGWSKQGNTVESQSLVGPALKLAGAPTLQDSSLSTRASKTVADIRSVHDEGDDGFIVHMPEGDVATTGKMNVFVVQVNSMGPSTDITGPSTIETTYALTGQPVFGVTIPT